MRAGKKWISWMGLAVILSLGCDGSTAPKTGAIKITVSTLGAFGDVDRDGYTLSIDGGPGQAVATNGTVTIADLPTGNHLVRLDGVAPNCSVAGINPRSVDVPPSDKQGSPLPVFFSVLCGARFGSIRVSTATSGPELDPDGYTLLVAGINRAHLPVNGAVTIADIREGPTAVTLTGLAGNCAVEGANPRGVDVPFGATVEVAFVIRCVLSGALRVTTATTGVDIDPNGYDLDIRLEGTSSSTRANVSPNGTVTFSFLVPGNYVLTLSDIMPNCDAVMPGPRVVAVAAGTATPVTLDIKCEAPRQIAFVNGSGKDADIWVVNSNSTGATRITTLLGQDVDPAWSPDGRIAFTSERDGNLEIYVMNANGTNQVRLTNHAALDFRPAWSPDGARITFVSTRDGNAEIYVMNADGTSPVRLTSNGAGDADPAWSPDGRRIAFGSDRDGGGGIWVMNADGSSPTRLTSNSRGDWGPAWSPDGSRIAFSRRSFNTSDIFTVNTDGSGLKQLTLGIENATDPAWSPNGRKIALGAVSQGYCYYYYYCVPYIVVVNADGIPYSPLTTPGQAYNPAWRP